MLPSVARGLCALQGSAQTRKWECFLVFGNFFLFKTPFPGRSSIPPSFVSFFVFYIFSNLLSKTMGCFSGCLMSSAGIQKLFCGIYSAFKCSFDEFEGEKVVSPSYSSTILGPPLLCAIVLNWLRWVLVAVVSCKIYHWCVFSFLPSSFKKPEPFSLLKNFVLLQTQVSLFCPQALVRIFFSNKCCPHSYLDTLIPKLTYFLL